MECKKCLRTKHRIAVVKKEMERRLKIITGTVIVIKQMIRDDRYCDDVLLQVASATNALKSLGSEILKCHMKSCMVQDIKNNNLEVIDDVFELFGKLK